MPTKKKTKHKKVSKKREAKKRDPIDTVEWVHRDELHANDYNPNKVFSIELKLLMRSILKNGWTHPVVRDEDNQIIDGFHRWTLSGTPEFIERWGGLVPVVTITDLDEAEKIAATVRHNRARGMHGVIPMAQIVTTMIEKGHLTKEEVAAELGMEMEEVNRLSEVRNMPDVAGDADSFGRAWRPKR